MRIKLHQGQYEVALNPARFKIICAGRRWGKSVLSRMLVLKWALDEYGLYWLVSPTYAQGKDIHWLQGFKREIPPSSVAKWNDSDLSVTLRNGSTITLKSAEHPDRLRGVKLRGLVVDEIASMRNWDWLWQEALRPTLTDYSSPAVFISTPKGFNHFYDLFQRGQGGDDAYTSWRFTSYDNPYIPKEEIDQAKKELDDDIFAQEYMADFRKFTGLVYKDFTQHHIIRRYEIPAEWRIYRAIDFGSTNPTACLWIAVDNDDNWYIVDEYYETGKTIDYHAGMINANPLSQRVIATYGDPSGAQWINEFSRRGVYITPANKDTGTAQQNWVRYGIEKVSEKIRRLPGRVRPREEIDESEEGYAQLYVFSHCENTIREFEFYRWKEKPPTADQALNEPDQPEKAKDHTMDALRYFAVSYAQPDTKDVALYGQDYELVNDPQEDKKWRIGR